MQKTILIFIILIYNFSFSQDCAKLHINKHIDGDPICNYGKYVKICLDEKQIEANNRTYYIKNSGQKDRNTMYFNLSMDRGYGWPSVGELLVNTSTQLFSLTIHNNSGIYSYFNESEMKIINAKREIERQKELEIERQNQEKVNAQKLNEDKNTIIEINTLISSGDITNVINKYNSLNFASEIKTTNDIDALISDSIDKYIYENNLNRASKLYTYLLLNENQTKYKSIIQNKLDDNYTKKIETISNELLNNFSTKHLNLFDTLSLGNHQLKIDKKGSVFIDNKFKTTTLLINEISIETFKVKTDSEIKLTVSEEFFPGKKLYFSSNSENDLIRSLKTHKLFINPNGSYSKKKYILFKEIIMQDNKIPKNLIRTIQTSEKKLIINNIIKIPIKNENELLYKTNNEEIKISYRTIDLIEEKVRLHWKSKLGGVGALTLLGGLTWGLIEINNSKEK